MKSGAEGLEGQLDRLVEYVVDEELHVLLAVLLGDGYAGAARYELDIDGLIEALTRYLEGEAEDGLEVVAVVLGHGVEALGHGGREGVHVLEGGGLLEQLLVESERKGQVDDGRVVDGQSAQLADQVIHVGALERLIVEPDGVGLLVEGEHAVLEVEYLAQQQHEELFLDAAGVVRVLADEHHFERLLEVVAPLLGQLIERVLDDVLASHEQGEQRVDRIDGGQEDAVDVLLPGLGERQLHLYVGVRLQQQRLGARVKHEREVAEQHILVLQQQQIETKRKKLQNKKID